MKILTIRGQNLASLKGHFEVNLASGPLAALGVFSIGGPVGSGKSTILDAMCLALFGRTPRLSGRGGAPLSDDKHAPRSNDPRALVRRGAALAFAEVEFLGVHGTSYRARWQVRRAHGAAFGRLLEDEHTLVTTSDDARIGVTNTDVRKHIVDALGLSFDELCRCVLLSQGGFTAFLHARPEERASLLETVTGTAIYSTISVLAFDRHKKESAALVALERQLDGFVCLDAHQLTARTAELTDVTAAHHVAQQQVAVLGVRVQRQHDRAYHQTAKAEATSRVAHVEQQALVAQERAQQCSDRSLALAADIERSRALDQHLTQLAIARLEEALSTAHAHAYASRARLSSLTVRREMQQGELASARAIAVQHQTLGPFVDRLAATMRELERLSEIELELVGVGALVERQQQDLDVERDARRLLQFEQSRALAQRRALRTAAPATVNDSAVIDVRAAIAQVRAEHFTRAHLADEQELVVERRALERLQRISERAHERQQLLDGEPCPLCGAIAHPFAAHTDDTAQLMVAQQRAAVHALASRALVAAQHAALYQAQADDSAHAGDTGVTPIVGPMRAWSMQHVDEVAAAFDAIAATERETIALEARDAVHADIIAELTAKLALFARDTEARRAEQLRLRANLSDTLADLWLTPQPNDLAAFTKDLCARGKLLHGARAQCDRLTQALSSTEEAYREAQRDAAVADALLRTAVDRFEAVREQHRVLTSERRALLQGQSVAQVCAQLQTQQTSAARAVEELNAALAGAQQTLLHHDDALQRLGVAHEDAAVALAHAQEAYANSAEARARLMQLLADDAAARQQHAQLAPQLAARGRAVQTWGELAALIGSHDGARFRVFAQSLTLDVLIGHANGHLASLAPRYRLRRVEDARARLELCVVDGEAGDERRSVASLSGGETFLVSLALALGLSSLSVTRARVQSLFIDEGFSSLDPDTLEVALAAFEMLHLGGRQVAVISHVPALAERLGSQVRVLPLGGGRSRVEVRAG